jgi:hypothetical protein
MLYLAAEWARWMLGAGLVAAEGMDQYSPYYDEVFWEVSARIRQQGEAGKLELAALICWKRSAQERWVSDLLELPDTEVVSIPVRLSQSS